MGLLSGITELVLQGASFGLSDSLGITGDGGLVHDESDCVMLYNEGIVFQGVGTVPWREISKLEDDGEALEIRHVGGLGIIAPKKYVSYLGLEEDVLSAANQKMQTEGGPIALCFQHIEENIDDIESKIDELEEAVSDLRLAKELHEKINGSCPVISVAATGFYGVAAFLDGLFRLMLRDETHMTTWLWACEHRELLIEITTIP